MVALIVGIVFIVIAFLGYTYCLIKIDNNKTYFAVLAVWFGLCSGICLLISYFDDDTYKMSKYSVRTEIKTTTLNGIETSRDTIYIFTPKKTKK